MELTPRYTFSLCIKRDSKILVGTEASAGDSPEEIARAKRTIQRSLNEYTPKTPTAHPKKTESPKPAHDPPPIQKVTPPVPEKPEGIRGLLQIRCPECNNIFGTFLKEYQTEVLCKCGHHIDLTVPLARFSYTCPYCEQARWGRTNLEDPEITVRCKCGGDVDLRWNPSSKEYQN